MFTEVTATMRTGFDQAMQNNKLALPRVLLLICVALLLAGDNTRADDRPCCNIFSVNKAELTGDVYYFVCGRE